MLNNRLRGHGGGLLTAINSVWEWLTMSSTSSPEIHVCHSGTCVSRGGESALVEIEELVRASGDSCVVRKTGCIGYCSQAPAVLVKARPSGYDSDPGKAPLAYAYA